MRLDHRDGQRASKLAIAVGAAVLDIADDEPSDDLRRRSRRRSQPPLAMKSGSTLGRGLLAQGSRVRADRPWWCHIRVLVWLSETAAGDTAASPAVQCSPGLH